MKVVIWSKGNVFLNEFSIPASGNRLSIWFTQYSFIYKFFPVCGNRKIQFLENNLFPGNTNRFLSFRQVEKHFLASGNAFSG